MSQDDSNPKGSFARRLARRVFRPRLLAVCALVAGIPYWLPILRESLPDLSGFPEYQVSHDRILIDEPPRQAPHDLVSQVALRANLPEKLSLLDDGLTEQIAEAFAAHPWVENVISVEKKPWPARVIVHLSYRNPVAMIEKKTGFYPIDAHGVVLPPEDFSLSETADYLKITNVRSAPFAQPGTPWNDPLIPGAARLAELLANDWKSLDLEAIHLPARFRRDPDPRQIDYSLITRGGSRIVWGKAPGMEPDNELDAGHKLEQLRQYLADYGSFERPSGPYEIDIRYEHQISRQKLLIGLSPVGQDPALK